MVGILALEELIKENEAKIALQKRQLADHESGENKLSRMAEASTENSLEIATDLLAKYNAMLNELLEHGREEMEEKERLFALAQRKKYFDAQDSRIAVNRELSSDQKLEVMRIIEELPDEVQFEDEKLFDIATKSIELSLPDLKELSEKLDLIKKDFTTLLKDAENGDLEEIGTINFLIPIVVLHFHVLFSNIKQTIDDINNKALKDQQDILQARSDEKEKLLNSIIEYENAVKARDVKRAEAIARKEADDKAKKELAKNMENAKEIKIEKIEKTEEGVTTPEGTEERATPEAIEGETPEVVKDEVAIQKDIEGEPLCEIEEGTITDAQLLEGTTLPEEDEEKIIPETIESEKITLDETTSEEIEDEEIIVEEAVEGTIPEEIEGEEITVEEIEEEIKEIDIAAITKAIGEIDKKAIPEITELKFSGFPKFEDWWIRELWMSHQAYFALFKWKAIINNLCRTTEQKKAWSIIFDRWVFIKKLLNDKGELAYNYHFAFDSLLVTYSEIEEEIDQKNILSMELIIKEITKKEDFSTTTSYHNVDTPYLKYKKIKLAPKKEKKEIEIELEKESVNQTV